MRAVAQSRPPLPLSHSTWLASIARVRDGRGVVRLVLARVVDRGRQAEEVGDPAAGRGDLLDPGQRRGGEQRRARARRRRRTTSAARSSRRRPAETSTGRPPAPEVASTSTSASSSAPSTRLHRRHDAGARLVVRPGVDVDAGLGARVGAGAGLAGDDRRLAEERRVPRHRGELARRTRRTPGAGRGRAPGRRRRCPRRPSSRRCRGRPRSPRAGRRRWRGPRAPP